MNTEQKHTPEPWKYNVNVGPTKGLIVKDDGSTILELVNTLRDSRFEGNVRRIVTCVNACAGIPIAELEQAPPAFADAVKAIEQRDELAKILRKIMNAHNSHNNGAFMGEAVVCQAFADEANAALAKVQS